MPLPPDMPRYRCHKEVHALKIDRVLSNPDGSVMLMGADIGYLRSVTVDRAVVSRYYPKPGDYLVVYESDGYRSISPAKAFEDGYTRISE